MTFQGAGASNFICQKFALVFTSTILIRKVPYRLRVLSLPTMVVVRIAAGCSRRVGGVVV